MKKHGFIAALAFAGTAAHAQQWYMDFGAGRATANGHPVPIEATVPFPDAAVTSFSFFPMTGSDTAFNVRGGARLGPYVAIEASYSQLGDYALATLTGNPGSVSSFDASARSAGAAVVGILPLQAFDLYARAGYARTQLKADEAVNGSAIKVDESFNETYYGAGARWNVTRQLGVFAEYERHDKLDLDAWFVGMQWRF